MFSDMAIVATAISSFNNAALYSPYFFVVGLFCVPAYILTFLYGKDFVSRCGWSGHDVKSNICTISLACLALWLLIFGGNYAVIRDGISLLPLMIALVLFVLFAFLTGVFKRLGYINKIKDKKWRWFGFFALFVLAGASAMPTWWGILLQISAVLCGVIVGDRLRIKVSDISFSTIIFTFMTILILMQPEYFRFGQLGNLTLVHILALVMCGFFGITTLITKYTNARSKIHQSAYIKLKWLCRILLLLALVLFALTESVPVFVASIAICGISQALFIYHNSQSMKGIAEQSWAMLLITFGIMIICPIITMLGIICLLFGTTKGIKSITKDFTRLL